MQLIYWKLLSHKDKHFKTKSMISTFRMVSICLLVHNGTSKMTSPCYSLDIEI